MKVVHSGSNALAKLKRLSIANLHALALLFIYVGSQISTYHHVERKGTRIRTGNAKQLVSESKQLLNQGPPGRYSNTTKKLSFLGQTPVIHLVSVLAPCRSECQNAESKKNNQKVNYKPNIWSTLACGLILLQGGYRNNNYY